MHSMESVQMFYWHVIKPLTFHSTLTTQTNPFVPGFLAMAVSVLAAYVDFLTAAPIRLNS